MKRFEWEPIPVKQRGTKVIIVEGVVIGTATRVKEHQQKGWRCKDHEGRLVEWWLSDLGACVRRLCRMYGKAVPNEYKARV